MVLDQKARELVSQVVAAGREKSLTYLAGTTPQTDFYPLARGFGAIINDEYGEQFVDFACGEQLLFGHRNPEIFTMIYVQMQSHTWQGGYGWYQDRLMADYAEALSTRFSPDKDGNPLQVFFVASPYEARMAAAQIAIHPPCGGGYFLSLMDATGVVREGGEVQDEVHRARAQGLKIIADEVVTGFGRTGTFCFYEQYFVDPDIIVLSAGTGGIPLSAVLAPRALFEGPSFVGLTQHIPAHPNSLACAAGVKTMLQLTPECIRNVSDMGAVLGLELRSACEQFGDVLAGVVGTGLIQTIRLVQPARGPLFRECCRNAGLLITPGLRLCPPLTVTEHQIKTAADAIAAACIDMGA